MTENTSNAPENHDRRFHRYLIAVLRLVGLAILLAVFVQVSWNMFAPDLLGLEPIRIKQALGLVVFAGAFVSLVRIGATGRLWTMSHG